MTTKHSPLRVLKGQADQMACLLKAAERGEPVPNDLGNKIATARQKDTVTFGVAMDDKFLKITMRWDIIRDTSEAGISAYIVRQMRESREPAH